eukprot:1453509-Pyramimonas_sp.AAC.1
MAGALPEVDQGPGVGCSGTWSGGPFPAGVASCSGSARASQWPTCAFRPAPGGSAGRAPARP